MCCTSCFIQHVAESKFLQVAGNEFDILLACLGNVQELVGVSFYVAITPATCLLCAIEHETSLTSLSTSHSSAPQILHTLSAAGFDKLGGFQKDKHAEMLHSIPLSRMGTKWDIGMACVFLASQHCYYLSELRSPLASKDVSLALHMCRTQ